MLLRAAREFRGAAFESPTVGEPTWVSLARRIGAKVQPAKCKAGVGNQFAETLIPDALSSDLVEKVDAYWRAANYLSVGQVSCALVTRL
jgi:hypothetical protein